MDEMKLKRIDLTKCCGTDEDPHGKNNHPEIDTQKQYLARIYGEHYIGSFHRVWYGLSFNNWGTSGIQLDSIEAVWEIIEFPA